MVYVYLPEGIYYIDYEILPHGQHFGRTSHMAFKCIKNRLQVEGRGSEMLYHWEATKNQEHIVYLLVI